MKQANSFLLDDISRLIRQSEFHEKALGGLVTFGSGDGGYCVNAHGSPRRAEASFTLIEEETGGTPSFFGVLSIARTINKRPDMLFNHIGPDREHCLCQEDDWICPTGRGRYVGTFWFADCAHESLEEALVPEQ